MKIMTGLLTLGIFFTGLASAIFAQSVTAFVDRNPIHVNETVQFTIRWSGPNPGTSVNLDGLRTDFDLLGTSQSNHNSIIHGRTKMTTEWVTTLAPKRAGRLQIPAIFVGPLLTPPITLKVLSQPQAGQQGVSRDIFLETSVEPNDPYVQSQATYTVRLYHAVPLREGRIEDPTVPDVVVTRLGEDVSFENLKDGRRYQVIERKFSIIPQKSGSLTIPPIVFDGKVPDKKGRRSLIDDLFDNQFRSFGNDAFSTIFQSTKPVRARSEAHTLQVQPVPQTMKDDIWLPAKELTLREKWAPDPGKAENALRVGEPVTRTIVLRAKGLTGPQLPEVPLAEQPQLKIYPDKPHIDTQNDGALSVGIREQKLALVPTAAGTLKFPEVKIPWWDVDQHKRRVAILPARTLSILPEIGKSSAPSTLAQQPISPGDPETTGLANSKEGDLYAEDKGSSNSTFLPLFWQSIAGVFFLGWLVTGVGWLYDRRQRSRLPRPQEPLADSKAPSEQKILAEFRMACQQNDPQKARAALLRWARAKWKSPSPMGLDDIAHQVKDTALHSALWDLDRSLYAPDASSWNGQEFYQLLLSALDNKENGKPPQRDVLSPLYLTRS